MWKQQNTQSQPRLQTPEDIDSDKILTDRAADGI